jgi:tetratricopeptide (TPR) repeat protein
MSGFVGREAELTALASAIDAAASGKGSAVIVSGGPGIGKTRLVDEAASIAAEKGFVVLRGKCSADDARPFLPFSETLGSAVLGSAPHVSFSHVMAIGSHGEPVAQASSQASEGADSDTIAGMLSTVQGFAKDSLGGGAGSLGRLDYGARKIIIERVGELTVAAMFEGDEAPRMRMRIREAVGNAPEGGLRETLETLASERFAVKTSVESVKLENERIRMANAMLEDLQSRASSTPTVLVLEDLQWADESSLFVLGYLARNVGESRALVFGTFRPAEGKALEAALAKMRGEGTMAEIRLDKLDRDAVAGLVETAYPGNSFGEAFLDSLAARCGGNPLFVIEFLKQMRTDGSIVVEGGCPTLAGESQAIPGSLEEVVQRRLAALSPDAMALSEYAACIGRSFGVGAAASAATVTDTASALRELRDAGIVVGDGESREFCHATFQNVIYSTISAGWRAAHHKAIGEHYEAANASSPDAVAYELARHFFKSHERRKAHRYCVLAGERAESSFAPEQAISLYTDALSLAPALVGITGPGGVAELTERLADLHELTGDYDAAARRLREIYEGPAEPEVRARALRKFALAMESKGNYDEALDAVAKAKSLLGGARTVELGHVLANEGAIYEQKRELDRSIATQTEALAVLKEAGGSEMDLARVYSRIGTCLWMKNDFDAALEYYRKELDICEHAKDLRGIAAGLNNVGIVYLRKGDYNSALEHASKARDIFAKIGDQSGVARATGNMGNSYSAKGEYEASMAEYKKCLRLFTRFGAQMPLGMLHMNIGSIQNHLGDFDGAMASYVRSREIREKLGDRRGTAVTIVNIGNLRYDMGENEAALELFNDARARCESVGDKLGVIHALLGISKAKLKLGLLTDAAEPAGKALSMSRTLGLKDMEHAALTVSGAVSAAAGDVAEAEKTLDQCIAYGKEGGYKRTEADALLERGRMWKLRGDSSSAERDMRAARAIYEGMRMAHIIRDIDRELGAVPAASQINRQ